MSHSKKPTYDLYELQKLLKDPNKRIITRKCFQNAVTLGFSNDNEIVAKIMELRKSDFYKTMEAKQKPGLWQDVYHLYNSERTFYIKLQKAFDGKGIVIQFKLK